MFEDLSFWSLFRMSLRYLELLSAIIGTLMFYKYKHTFLKYFLILLWYTALNEFLGKYIIDYQLENNLTGNNRIIYNIYNTINFVVLLLIYKHYIQSKTFKKWIVGFIATYLISLIISGFYENYLVVGQSTSYIVGASFLIISIAYYFIEILNSDKVLNIQKSLLFWISVGLLLFHIGSIPFAVVSNYYASIPDLKYMFYVRFVLIAILYSLYIIGFIWSEKEE
ncbi:MAG: hypothetical protein L3J14_01460 [Flavobacteriaceae bacterium]|nr:hypothetical protein [Flavobacteriaceae bacterium]